MSSFTSAIGGIRSALRSRDLPLAWRIARSTFSYWRCWIKANAATPAKYWTLLQLERLRFVAAVALIPVRILFRRLTGRRER